MPGHLNRRSLLLAGACAAGAAWAPARLAAAAAPVTLDQLAAAVEQAEAVRAVKRLQHGFAHYAELGLWTEMGELFAREGELRHPAANVSGLDALRGHFLWDDGQGSDGLAPGRINTRLVMSPVITVAPDGRSAKGRWHEMALLGAHGGRATWAGGVYENDYVLEDGVWRIFRSSYHPQYAGPYEGGWRNTPAEPVLAPYHYDPRSAGVPVPALAGVAATPREAASLEELQRRIDKLADEAQVLRLQNAYGYYFDRKRWDDVADLFAPDGVMELGLQGVYVGPASIRRGLERFGPQGLRAGEVFDHLQLAPVVSVSGDGKVACIRGFELAMTGQNGKDAQWGVSLFENSYVKDGGVWKIASMRVVPRMRADYAQGWAASALPVPGPSAEFPPDRPPTETFETFPRAAAAPAIHFPHPVTGKPPVYPRNLKVLALGATPPTGEAAPRPTTLDAAWRDLEAAAAPDGAENVSNAYGYYIDEFRWDDTADLFAVNGWKELSYVGVYVGRERVRTSLKTRYGPGGRRSPTLAIHQKTQPVVTVAPDGRSARIRTRLFQVNSAPEAAGSYIAGIYENQAVKEDGVWKILGMNLDYTWTASYSGGWSKVEEGYSRRYAPTPEILKTFPPDRPNQGVVFAPFPEIVDTGIHYLNPVSGRRPPVLLEG